MLAGVAELVDPAVLAATPQDAAFHSEGDVWTHTQMALAELVTLPGYLAADAHARDLLEAAVLLHDIGKPAMTRTDGERITSRGHSAKGEHLARVALWRAGVPFHDREHVCALVRSHQVPMFGITRPDAAELAIRLSLVTRNDWLAIVAEADARGRRCADPADHARIIEHCQLWTEHCRELGVLDHPRAFASDHTRRLWCESPLWSPDVAAYDDTTCEVTLLSGLPASGKSSWLAAHPELPAVSLDDLRAEQGVDPGETPGEVIAAAREQAREYLRAGTAFAWNATNLTAALRRQLVTFVRGYRARTRIIYTEVTAAELAARNRSRPSPVPGAVVERMLGRWSVPDPTEAHRVEHLIPTTPASVFWPPE